MLNTKRRCVIMVALCMSLFFVSCQKEAGECVRVEFVSTYCPKSGGVIVNIEQNTGGINQIALLNVPQSYMVAGKIFYVTYHYDEALDKVDEPKVCPAINGNVKIFVADLVSETGCNN